MPKTASELKDIARLGGNLSIDATTKTSSELRDITKSIESDAMLIIRNADSMTASELKDIARLAAGKVIFEV